jgi:hypothetical protein
MNNSSESDELTNNNKIQNIQKKRGRPRKNLFNINNKPKDTYETTELKNKDLILHIPVFMGKNKLKIVKNKTDVQAISNNISATSKTDITEIDDFNDDLNSVNDNESTESNDSYNSKETYKEYKKLYKKQVEEIKKKDMIIKKLKEECEKKNINNIFDSDINKECKTHIINLNLIDNKTNKLYEEKKTELNCWWCTYPINNYPCVIPEKYYNEKYYVFGCFCSVNCASSYNLNLNDHKIMERYALLIRLYNKTNNKINLAPPKEILKKYGGIIDIEEYRNNFITCDKEYRLLLPPVVLLNHSIDETISENNNNNTNEILTVNKKRIATTKNNLFNTMGIKKD